MGLQLKKERKGKQHDYLLWGRKQTVKLPLIRPAEDLEIAGRARFTMTISNPSSSILG